MPIWKVPPLTFKVFAKSCDIVCLCFSFIFNSLLSQTNIKFEDKSLKVDANVIMQIKEVYKQAKNNSEVLMTVMSKKEKKNLSQNDQIKYSRIRINKFYHDSQARGSQ